MYQRHYMTRLWSEAKKSAKTFLAARLLRSKPSFPMIRFSWGAGKFAREATADACGLRDLSSFLAWAGNREAAGP